MRGGYQMVSLKNLNIKSTPILINDVYDTIENTMYKPIMLTDIVIDGVNKNSLYVEISTNETNYVIDLYGGTLTITNKNMVSFTKNEEVGL